MKITREADYALRIIAMLADENRQIEAKAIAEKRYSVPIYIKNFAKNRSSRNN